MTTIKCCCNMKPPTNWSRQKILKLIDIYRSKEVLWNPRHPHYYRKVNKNKAWAELAMEINMPVRDCRWKMLTLRSSLRRERSRIRKSKLRGETGGYESSWFALKSLMFLWDQDESVKEETNENSYFISDDEALNLDCQPLNEHALTYIHIPANPQDEQNREQDFSEDSALPSTTNSTKIPNHRENFKKLSQRSAAGDSSQTECQIFGKFVGKKLEKFSYEEQILLQQSIMNIIFKADKAYCRQNAENCEPSTIFSMEYNVDPKDDSVTVKSEDIQE